ncbi:MAG TPA: GNAT family protein [Kofleriaceae bacterium]|nr:GNAT family protein [Kofleriaceae bacterium]
MPKLTTPRLELIPITLDILEAVVANDKIACERLAGAAFPDNWPNEDLIARAFPVSMTAVRADPAVRLWGDTLVIEKRRRDGTAVTPRVVGSVIFHGFPADGVAEVGYGVEEDSRGQGLAAEATNACVRWALAQPGIVAVQATTFPWHSASLGVIRRLGMQPCGRREHDTLGELLVFELRSDSVR